MVIVNVLPEPVQPVAFVAVSVPVYVPAAVFAAMGMLNGLDVIAVLARLTRPAERAAASHVMAYSVGVPVVAL
jgi:hypothetical protein